jgi:PAS domain S-box-containing protein
MTGHDTQERPLSAEQLRQHDRIFRSLVENAREYAIFMMDVDGRVASWNDGARRIIGYEEHEILGRLASVIFTPEDLAAGADAAEIEGARTRGRAEDRRWHVRKDGSRFWANGIMEAVLDDSGAVIGLVKILRDETDIKRDEMARAEADRERARLLAAAEAARAEAESANRQKDIFIAVLSHELRTPLNAILGWTKMLRGSRLTAEDQGRALETIERNARAQAQLIEDLLDVSRVISGKLHLEMRPVELAPVVMDAVEAVRPSAAANRVELRDSITCSAGSVHGDAGRLRQIVSNLLTNAIKFTPEGGRVEIAVACGDDDVEIVVRDTGRGIDPSFLPSIFDPFAQADAAAKRQGGLGLGLAIVRQLVELHGGRISAESEGPGRGATFRVSVPLLRREDAAPGGGDPDASQLGAEVTTLDGVRVLVVDDTDDPRDYAATVLAVHGAEVRDASSAQEAIEVLEAWRPDVLVSDIAMPGVDGYALIRQVRSRSAGEGGSVPAIALTAYAGSEDRRRALLAGYQTHLPKPIEPRELLAAVANLAPRDRRK